MATDAQPVPEGPFVGLYGSSSSMWRAGVLARLRVRGVPTFDTTHPGWEGIHADNGDAMQATIDALVAREVEGLRRATAVLWVIEGASLASRVEFGYLCAAPVPTFYVVRPDVVGRNHLWAMARNFPHLHRADTPDAAVEALLAWWPTRSL